MATHVGTSGLVKVGGTTVGEVIGFSIDETQDTVEDTTLTESTKSDKVLRGDATATVEFQVDKKEMCQEELNVGTQATLELDPEGADSGDKYYSGSGIVTGASIAVTLDGIISRTFNFQISGGISHLSV